MSPFKNPIRWSRSVAGSSSRVKLLAILHILAGIMVVWFEGHLVFVLFTTVFPIFYLYTMRHLLLALDQKEEKSENAN
ncbi:MAG: hypothetical protein AYK18_12055 [Theionarchaea archaeon DG-70]|nr:MAG: hypothetical protein AYK18_12055 [Theionarchaea archaeon DG-70]